jgi:hypothetical protein
MGNLPNDLEKFYHHIDHKQGHSFLYDLFDQIVIALRGKEIFTLEETRQIEKTIHSLLSEARVYVSVFAHRPWAARCLYCADVLSNFIDDTYYAEQILKTSRDIINADFMTFVSVIDFDTYVEKRKKLLQYEEILFIAKKCLYESDMGRRPRDESTEQSLKFLVLRGHDLYDWYLVHTNDIDSFPSIHEQIQLIHLQRIIEMLVEHDGYQTIENLINITIERHLVFYRKWIKSNVESFLISLEVSFIHDLLEFYEDDDFFAFLNLMSKSENPKAEIVVRQYLLDDEDHIKRHVHEIVVRMGKPNSLP